MKQSNKEWSGKSRGGSFGYRFFVMLIRFLGIDFAYVFLSLVVFYFIVFSPKSTRAIWFYNREILKYSTIKSICKLYVHYYTFGQTLIDKIAIKNGLEAKYEFEFENIENAKLLFDKKSTFIIGAHVGSWEIGAPFFKDYANKLNIVMLDAEHEKIKSILKAQENKYKIIPLKVDDLNSIIKIKTAVNNDEIVCFEADRYLSDDNAYKVNFLGRQTHFAKGAFVLAEKFKVPVVFHFVMRQSGKKYKLIFKIVDKNLPFEELIEEYKVQLQNCVRQYPQQWFNFYNIWEN